MANPKVFVIPGFLGSHLKWVQSPDRVVRLWLSSYQLLNGAIQKLRLNANGTNSFDAYLDSKILPQEPMLDYYKQIGLTLQNAFDVHFIAYDWRRTIRDRAQEMFDQIANIAPGEDIYIVAHSMGGLIARLFYRIAVQTGTAARVKRIVTIGTPHWGSYAATWVLAHLDPTYQQIVRLTTGSQLLSSPTVSGLLLNSVSGWGATVVDRSTGSWPALYELLPFLTQPNWQVNDPERDEQYDQGFWAGIQDSVSTKHFTDAAGLTQPQLLQSIPPDSILVSVVGKGIPTPAAFKVPYGNPTNPNSYRFEDGDGQVTAASAGLGANKVEVFGPSHGDLPKHPAVLQLLQGLLLNGPAQPVEEFLGIWGFDPPAGPAGPPRTLPIIPPNVTFDFGSPVTGAAVNPHDC